MNRQTTWHRAIQLAAHYKAIGQADIWLHDTPDMDRPWEFVTDVKEGGSHRLNISTSVHFTARHPSGLAFSWFIDIEDRDANGKGHYEINTKRIKAVMALLPAKAQSSFKTYLANCAAAVALKGREWQGYADRQKNDAKILADLSR